MKEIRKIVMLPQLVPAFGEISDEYDGTDCRISHELSEMLALRGYEMAWPLIVLRSHVVTETVIFMIHYEP